MAASKGWFNLEAAGGVIPDTQFFEGDSAFKFLGLTRTQRLYGFVGWYVLRSHAWRDAGLPSEVTACLRVDMLIYITPSAPQSRYRLHTESARGRLPVSWLAGQLRM